MDKLYKEEKVVKWMENNNTYSLSNGVYRFPKFIDRENSTPHNRSYIKFGSDWVNSEYLTKRAPGELKFIENLKIFFSKYGLEKPIEQLVLPISNRELWKELCPKNYQDRLFFVVDVFLTSGIAIELDYDSTHQCPEYDKARDTYIKEEYGIVTWRLFDYGTTIPGTLKGDRIILDAIEYQLFFMSGMFKVDYSKTYLKTFELDFYNELKIIENLPKKLWGQSSLVCKKSLLERIYKRLKIKPDFNKLGKFMEAVGVEFEYV